MPRTKTNPLIKLADKIAAAVAADRVRDAASPDFHPEVLPTLAECWIARTNTECTHKSLTFADRRELHQLLIMRGMPADGVVPVSLRYPPDSSAAPAPADPVDEGPFYDRAKALDDGIPDEDDEDPAYVPHHDRPGFSEEPPFAEQDEATARQQWSPDARARAEAEDELELDLPPGPVLRDPDATPGTAEETVGYVTGPIADGGPAPSNRRTPHELLADAEAEVRRHRVTCWILDARHERNDGMVYHRRAVEALRPMFHALSASDFDLVADVVLRAARDAGMKLT